jgi:hypothetical protein
MGVAVDMIGFGVNSVGNHNYPLCWSIIPHNTEGEPTYTGTFLVDTAQCDQIMGWVNFTSELLGIDPNTRKNHLLGNLQSVLCQSCCLTTFFLFTGIAAVNYSHVNYLQRTGSNCHQYVAV